MKQAVIDLILLFLLGDDDSENTTPSHTSTSLHFISLPCTPDFRVSSVGSHSIPKKEGEEEEVNNDKLEFVYI
jgi:hypothetical protein